MLSCRPCKDVVNAARLVDVRRITALRRRCCRCDVTLGVSRLLSGYCARPPGGSRRKIPLRWKESSSDFQMCVARGEGSSKSENRRARSEERRSKIEHLSSFIENRRAKIEYGRAKTSRRSLVEKRRTKIESRRSKLEDRWRSKIWVRRLKI